MSENTEAQAPEYTEVTTAFLVFLTPEGTWQASNDINAPLAIGRPATVDDMKAGGSCVALDAQTMEIAQQVTVNVLQNMMNLGAQMRAAQMGPQVPGEMNLPGGVPLLTGHG